MAASPFSSLEHAGEDETSARDKHWQSVVIDPPVTPEEALADALAAFGLLCDRAIEYLDMLGWQDTLTPGSPAAGS